MSTRYPGGIITKTPVVPTGPYENGTAPGIWTLDQQLQAQKAGIWPLAGNPVPYIEDMFSTYLYTGTNASQTITNGIDLSGKGGLVWTKNRSALTGAYTGFDRHILFDNIRTGATGGGAGGGGVLRSNAATLDDATTTYLSSYNSTGYTIASNATISNAEFINQSGTTFVSWTFRKQPKFFDVVTWTGNGANRTIAHSLGSVPGAIWVKRIDATGDWQCYHRSLANTQYMVLNTTAAVDTGATRWNSTTPTSSVFSLGTDATVNASAGTYVAYLFAHDAGGFGLTGTDNVISCGSYTGTGVNPGPAINLGYEPQFIIVKNTTSAVDWFMYDTMRGMPVSDVNTGSTKLLRPNTTAAEQGGNTISPTATGFQINTTAAGANTTSDTYIYIAIRRGPMEVPTVGTEVFSTAITTNASFPRVTTTFPIDMGIFRSDRTAVNNWNNGSRLTMGSNVGNTSGGLLRLNLTNAEVSDTSVQFDSNVGGWSISSTDPLAYSFRRAPGFFDEVCYTGTSANRTLPHNLTVAPELIIQKSRAPDPGAVANRWLVGTNFGATTYRRNWLELTDASTTYAYTAGAGFSGQPTSSNFFITDNYNASGTTYVVYLFATVAGVSKVGSYTGTGTTLQINCGFTAGSRFVLIKRTDSTGDWYVWDSARGIVAGNDPYLLLNSTAAEVTGTDYVDTYSAGFEISSTAPAAINANGGSFIFFAVS